MKMNKYGNFIKFSWDFKSFTQDIVNIIYFFTK